MMPTLQELGLDKWTSLQRLQLAETLWDSIAADDPVLELSEAQMLDLKERLERYAEDPKAGSDWETVKARILADCQ
jgi:putative addiction module component (TIGR02574 family)